MRFEREVYGGVALALEAIYEREGYLPGHVLVLNVDPMEWEEL